MLSTLCTGKPFTVGNIKRGKKKRTFLPPFITSTLQQKEASRKLNMTPRAIAGIAQGAAAKVLNSVNAV